MEFSPNNKIVKLCLQGMALEAKNLPDEAAAVFLQAWNEASDDAERFIAAHYVARSRTQASERLRWLETALRLAQAIDDDAVRSAFPPLFSAIADCHEELGDPGQAATDRQQAASFTAVPTDRGPFFHGTKADLKVGELLTAGKNSNYQSDLAMNHVYFTALPNGAGLAAGLAKGEGSGRVYVVEPTGAFEDDPNVTNKKFPGNPTRSYRSESPLRVVAEALEWEKQTDEDLAAWRERLAANKGKIIN